MISAAHVINERHHLKDKEIWIWNYSDGSKITITEDIVGAIGDGNNIPHWCDIAIIELDIKQYSTFNSSVFFRECFLHLYRVIPDIYYDKKDNESNHHIIAGYPSSQNKIIKSRYRKPRMFLYSTTEIPDTEDYSASMTNAIDEAMDEAMDEVPNEAPNEVMNDVFNKALTISLQWDNSKLAQKGASLPTPQGMSGGGVWMLSNKGEFNPRLHAISIAYSRSEKKVTAVKMAYVLSMLKAYFGLELKEIDIPKSFVEIKESRIFVPMRT
ncbi:hypothetical protein Q4R10_12275 [Morganella morganii]